MARKIDPARNNSSTAGSFDDRRIKTRLPRRSTPFKETSNRGCDSSEERPDKLFWFSYLLDAADGKRKQKDGLFPVCGAEKRYRHGPDRLYLQGFPSSIP